MINSNEEVSGIPGAADESRNIVNIKILFVNPMSGIEGFLPIGLSSLIAIARKEQCTVDIFDTTYYKITNYEDRQKNEKVGEFLPADMTKYGVVREERDHIGDLNAKIKEFDPDIIAVTVPTSYNYPLAMALVDGISRKNCPLIIGGKCVTMNPEKFIKNANVDIVCVGEGEAPFRDLCLRIREGKPYDAVRNLWVKTSSGVVKNDIRLIEDLDALPFPDWTLFDKRHFYKPFCGKVYRYGHLELSRGCPHRCSYCNNDRLQELYKGKGRYFRKKSIPRAIEEISFLKDKYDLEMMKFWDEEFFLYSDKEMEEFAQGYKKIALPFLIAARLDMVTEHKAKLLKEMGCVNVSAGIESGSEDIRRRVLNRKMTNSQIIRGISILNKYGIRTSTLNMVGMPFETRGNVFETIELNRKARAQNSSVMILQPWEGTAIRKMAVEAGFLPDECENYRYTESYLNMPQLPPAEIVGLAKTFSLYRKVPKIAYPLVRLCEKDGPWRDKLFNVLHRIFKSR
ncbi:MAG: B12-binding domain-containing radical SAM protein [Candidatus Omnitrophica bacterium]|nr:B12-binding domain-containing radical SAM protein [Candidatus Omnitrophota bacterium]MBU1808077.1 B12-binding domain-containing radical SAM protein [Candidatus Omnitrophota bacterium]